MDMMEVRRRVMLSMASGGRIDFLQELTFVNALGSADRQTVEIPETWDKYDILLIIPNLTITAQEGQTNGNWLWYGLYRKSDNVGAYSYDGNGQVGTRTMGRYTVVISKGTIDSDSVRWMIGCWQNGRIANFQALSDDKLSDLKFKFGTYYDGTYGLLNGTAKIYGLKFPS